MKLKSSLIVAALAASLPIALADYGKKAKKDIVDTAVAAGSFNTLAAALKAADLVGALKSEGPFTVFAPTDEAFAKLPEGTVETLLKPENKDKLVDILTYHVVPAKVPAATAVTLDKAEALNKKSIAISKKGDALFLNESKVVKTDIKCSNGIIHVIDAVLLPPEEVGEKAAPASENVIRMAIHTGVPLYNDGNHAACAAVYEVAARSLLAMPEDALNDHQRGALMRALTKVDSTHCATTNSWVMREALDSTMRMMTTASTR